MAAPPESSAKRKLVFAVRYVLPGALIAAAFVILIVAPDSARFEGFSMAFGSGLSILLLNLLFRLGAEGDKDRTNEEAAREYLAAHGHWPGEAPPRK